jgi:hypothetical protein
MLSKRRANDEPPASNVLGAELFCELRLWLQHLSDAFVIDRICDQFHGKVLPEEPQNVLDKHPASITFSRKWRSHSPEQSSGCCRTFSEDAVRAFVIKNF